jgi:putative ABC transport system permease protein
VVVGVVAHVHTETLETDPLPQVYWSTGQWTQDRMAIAVRSVLDAAVAIPSVIRAVRTVDPDQSVYDVRTMDGIIDRSQARRHLTTLLMLGFGAVALALAAVGIYGVVAFGVTQRMREFGIRIAIGATRGDVTRLIVRQGTTVAVAGAVIGLTVALAGAGNRSLVYEVAPRDTGSILGGYSRAHSRSGDRELPAGPSRRLGRPRHDSTFRVSATAAGIRPAARVEYASATSSRTLRP